jgi:hypothetical protein
MSPQRMVRDQWSIPSQKIVPQSNSVRRAFAILELLEDSDRRRNLSEKSAVNSTLPKSTLQCLVVHASKVRGYIGRAPTDRRYLLTTKAFGFGLALVESVDLSRRARPVLGKIIAHALRVTAHIAVCCRATSWRCSLTGVDGVAQPCCDIYPGRRANSTARSG